MTLSELCPSWLSEPPAQALLAALAAGGIEARFVGGCVRDALLGRETGDIDLATPARPEAVIAALETAKIKALPTGVAHGTVTAVIAPRTFEITTLRRDVETDGRHAVVAFGASWEEDAARRDFTINAVYLAPDGRLFDPFGGKDDLAARRVHFIGDAATRIAQDVLRVLRYYRFEARFGGGAGDAAARAACRGAAGSLRSLSAERVWRELSGLLLASDAVRVLRLMREDGILAELLPQATRFDRLQRLMAFAEPRAADDSDAKQTPQDSSTAITDALPLRDPILRLEALIDLTPPTAVAVAGRLKLSSSERERLQHFASLWPELTQLRKSREWRAHLFLFGRDDSRDVPLIAAAERNVGQKKRLQLLKLAAEQPPKFPLNGKDVIELGITPGPRVGDLLDKIKYWWAEQDFVPDRDACLRRLRLAAGEG